MAVSINSLSGQRALKSLGENIKIARLKRRISVAGFAERTGVSERTIIRLEKGDAGVSIGTLVMACVVLGETDRIARFLDQGSDDTGLMFDQKSLPKRIDKARKKLTITDSDNQTDSLTENGDEEGIGF